MRAAEEQEYDWYFRACFAPVSRTVFLMVHDRELAEDVTQEALYRMLRHWRAVSEYDGMKKAAAQVAKTGSAARSIDSWDRRVAVGLEDGEVLLGTRFGPKFEIERLSVKPAGR